MRAEVESGPGGWRMSPQQVHQERLKIAVEMLALNLKETALLPVKQQQQVRQAMTALTDVWQWCQRQAAG